MMASATTQRDVTVDEAERDLAGLLEAVAGGEEVVIRAGGEPRAVLIPYQAYRELAEKRDRQRREDALRDLVALRATVRARNQDLTEEQAEAIAEEISQAAIDNLVERGVLRFARDRI